MNEMLYAITLTDGSDNFDLASEMLSALEVDFSSWEDRENRRVVHSVYFQTPEEREAALPRLRETIREWSDFGLKITAVEPNDIRKEDWAEAWKKYFHVIEVSGTLAIKPSWLEFSPKPGQAVLEIDPGMSFGTGQHATTLFCLQTIDRLAGTPGVETMLDAGCGSGILAIAAALRNYRKIDAFDYDPEAVTVAKENLAANGISEVLPTIADAAVYQGPCGTYDLVCANILGHLLKAYRHNIASWVRPGGYLALAGILEKEFDDLSRNFTAIGFEELERATLREWTSGLFRKK